MGSELAVRHILKRKGSKLAKAAKQDDDIPDGDKKPAAKPEGGTTDDDGMSPKQPASSSSADDEVVRDLIGEHLPLNGELGPDVLRRLAGLYESGSDPNNELDMRLELSLLVERQVKPLPRASAVRAIC